jgi:hypothetical protein
MVSFFVGGLLGRARATNETVVIYTVTRETNRYRDRPGAEKEWLVKAKANWLGLIIGHWRMALISGLPVPRQADRRQYSGCHRRDALRGISPSPSPSPARSGALPAKCYLTFAQCRFRPQCTFSYIRHQLQGLNDLVRKFRLKEKKC